MDNLTDKDDIELIVEEINRVLPVDFDTFKNLNSKKRTIEEQQELREYYVRLLAGGLSETEIATVLDRRKETVHKKIKKLSISSEEIEEMKEILIKEREEKEIVESEDNEDNEIEDYFEITDMDNSINEISSVGNEILDLYIENIMIMGDWALNNFFKFSLIFEMTIQNLLLESVKKYLNDKHEYKTKIYFLKQKNKSLDKNIKGLLVYLTLYDNIRDYNWINGIKEFNKDEIEILSVTFRDLKKIGFTLPQNILEYMGEYYCSLCIKNINLAEVNVIDNFLLNNHETNEDEKDNNKKFENNALENGSNDNKILLESILKREHRNYNEIAYNLGQWILLSFNNLSELCEVDLKEFLLKSVVYYVENQSEFVTEHGLIKLENICLEKNVSGLVLCIELLHNYFNYPNFQKITELSDEYLKCFFWSLHLLKSTNREVILEILSYIYPNEKNDDDLIEKFFPKSKKK